MILKLTIASGMYFRGWLFVWNALGPGFDLQHHGRSLGGGKQRRKERDNVGGGGEMSDNLLW